MSFPLYVTYRFSLAAVNILSLCLSLLAWLVCVSACFSFGLSYMGLSTFLGLINYFLSHTGEVFNYNVFKIFLSVFLFLFFLWDPYNSNVDAFNVVPEVSGYPQFFSFFFFYSAFQQLFLPFYLLAHLSVFYLNYLSIDFFLEYF